MPAAEEHVLVIPEAVLERLGGFEGFQPEVAPYVDPLLESEELSFQPRSRMENDPRYKQLIPYVLLEWTDPSGTCHLFQYTRGSGQGEKRLHARRSVGIGGHISEEDAAGRQDPYRTGMLRELTEEVRLETPYDETLVGLIYDPTTEVGRVHLGIVHRFRLQEPKVQPNETDLVDAGFAPVAELAAEPERLEKWSQLALAHLYAG